MNEIPTRFDIENEFKLNAQGLITNPGKFEGSPTFVPYFYHLSLTGFWDEEYIDEADGYTYTTFYPDYVDIVVNGFIELRHFKTITIWSDDQGFVHHKEEPWNSTIT